jgi:hypothetical protein
MRFFDEIVKLEGQHSLTPPEETSTTEEHKKRTRSTCENNWNRKRNGKKYIINFGYVNNQAKHTRPYPNSARVKANVPQESNRHELEGIARSY